MEISEIESFWLQIFISTSNSFLISFVYRPPNSTQSWIDSFDEQIEMADSSFLDYYILGDLNINYIPEQGSESFNNTKWMTTLTKFGLLQLIQHPTRTTKKSSTIIDHIYANNVGYVEEIFVSSLSVSDHFPVCMVLSAKINNNKKNGTHKVIKYRMIKKVNEKIFNMTF